ncbi:MAG: helix-turn-helix domain-containing protein [Spirochaetia bacterium]|nr:helix-turn-helix domain-containing protein [Spirochaetia bacterium]
MTKSEDNEALLTYKEIASYLRISPVTLRRYVSEGRIPYLKIGRSVRFRKEHVDTWLEKNNH